MFFASANAAIQHRVDDAVRGRVLSLYAMIFSGTGPLGGLLTAGLASRGGTALALAVEGGICVVAALVVAPIFLRRLQAPVCSESLLADEIAT